MSAVLGLVLGLGLILTVSPWLWPRAARSERSARTLAERMRGQLAAAGLPEVSPPVFVAASAIMGLLAGAVVLALIPVVMLALGAAVAAASLPAQIVLARIRRRRAAARAVWPDVVDHLLGGVRSGLALPDVLASLADAGPTQTRAAFAFFEREHRTTAHFGAALDALKSRLADPVADRIVESLRMAREVGGTELPNILRNLSAHLRADAAIRSEVEARQSWVVNAARLGVAAPWVVLALLASRPEAATAYNSPAGFALLVVGFAVTIIAYRIMLAIGRVPQERRWFA